MEHFALLHQRFKESEMSMESTKKPMTSGQFRNYQFNEVKKSAFVMAVILTLLTGTIMMFVGIDNLMHFLRAALSHKAAFVSFLFLAFTLTLWLVYFAAKELANNKHWVPNDPKQPVDYKTQGVMK